MTSYLVFDNHDGDYHVQDMIYNGFPWVCAFLNWFPEYQ